MTWFTAVERPYHPCHLPPTTDTRIGEYWRCEVCDEIWRLEETYGPGKEGRWVRVTSRRLRWKFRKYGWTKGSS